MRFGSYILAIVALFIPVFSSAQSAPISIDGVYTDWPPNLATFTDVPESITGIDLLEMQVSNDDEFLFIRIIIDTEINLTSDLVSQHLMLYIDTDDNPSTGYNAQTGYGSELGVVFRERLAHYNVSPYSQVSFSDIQMRPAPTVTSNQFEIAIGRDLLPDGINPLFPSSTIRILFKDLDSGDSMPNTGEIFYYTFDETPVTPLVPTDLEKQNENFIRIVAYNTLYNGLIDPSRVANFETIIKLLNPDIIGFSECNDTNPDDIKILLDNWIPLGNSDGWYVVNDYGGDLITLSRWPILQHWQSLYRQLPVFIDLPENYNTDLLFTNAHLRCCSANYERQEQVDHYVAFMLDAQSQGGEIDLPQDTPFVYAGDLNLVGFVQQLTTLLTGAIQNTATYGQGAQYDWDNTDLIDQICRQTDKRMAYTWRHDSSSYPPGRLDFMIYSDAVMETEKAFTLQTEVMPADRLQTYGLGQYETSNASDHFPVVTDFSINVAASISEVMDAHTSVYPNPAKENIKVLFDKMGSFDIYLYDSCGVIVFAKEKVTKEFDIDLRSLSPGMYFLSTVDFNGNATWHKVIKE